MPSHRKRKKRSVDRRVAILVRNLPERIRNVFKAYCAKRGISMQDRIVELIKEDVELEEGPE